MLPRQGVNLFQWAQSTTGNRPTMQAALNFIGTQTRCNHPYLLQATSFLSVSHVLVPKDAVEEVHQCLVGMAGLAGLKLLSGNGLTEAHRAGVAR